MVANFKGFDSLNLYSNPEGSIVGIKNVPKRLKIFFENDLHQAYDPYSLQVTVEDAAENVIVSGSYVATPPPPPGLILKEALGTFYLPTESAVVPIYNLVAAAPVQYIMKWLWQDSAGAEQQFAMSTFNTLTTAIYSQFPRLRNQIDKAFKVMGCARVGYTDANLMYYLQGGLDEINAFPPVTGFSLASFPAVYGQLLINSATIVALISQSLFAVDTDTLSFSDQGFSFTSDHFARLQSMYSSLLAQTKEQLKILKFEYSGIAGVVLQIVPSYPFNVVLKTSPRGALFRNLFASG